MRVVKKYKLNKLSKTIRFGMGGQPLQMMRYLYYLI